MTLLCFDPGQTTGIAKFVDRELVFWQETTLWNDLDQLIRPKTLVVYESVYWRGPGFRPVGLEVIGVIKYLCQQCGIQPIPQSPSLIVGVQKWPIYNFKIFRSQHIADAVSHGIVFLKTDIKFPLDF